MQTAATDLFQLTTLNKLVAIGIGCGSIELSDR